MTTSLFSLPNEVILSALAAQFPCRGQQIISLYTLVTTRGALSRNIVLHGLTATGKSAITKAILEKISTPALQDDIANPHPIEPTDQLRYAMIKSAECITGRHLLEQTIGAVAKAIGWEGNVGRCENVATLVVVVGKMMECWTESGDESVSRRLVLVFDAIDRQRDVPTTMLPALARMAETIPNLSSVYIVTAPRPNFLHRPGVPHIQFPSYTKAELLQIVSSLEPTPRLLTGSEDTKNVWTRFCPAVYDSLSKHSGRDILSFRHVCMSLWPRFIQPILDGTHYPTPFSRLLVANRSLFQNDGVLTPSIISPKTFNVKPQTQFKLPALASQLPFHTRLLLLASYLASFNPARTDITHFMKSALAKRRKKGGGTALTKSNAGTSKNRKISRKLLGPQAFVLERMLAIFMCLRDDAGGRKGNLKARRAALEDVNGSADVHTAIATLASLRLLVRMGVSNSADALDGGSRYKVAVGWEVVRVIGRSVGIEMEDYLAD
ncbi:origin recognition complex subunit 5 C-terminus-domain-containing protein [Amylocarpus encephaloides]|uniref:Origin recognition complex subunit 5 C-terminus-domain-containing protein n=1 Tax=Amylocarpus encephaloides TaxID=45428 RepID=A0A9P7YLR5_9HELO|nr:origin recognition complex subunit 5 C-terminus-domain-containing protein [Amylocarpus encephaloides]